MIISFIKNTGNYNLLIKYFAIILYKIQLILNFFMKRIILNKKSLFKIE